MGYVYLACAVIFNSLGNVFVKIHGLKGFNVSGNLREIVVGNIYFLGALFLFALNLVMYSLALNKIPLSLGYAIMAVASFILVNTFSFFYFREHINPIQVLGYVFILIGISLVILFARN